MADRDSEHKQEPESAPDGEKKRLLEDLEPSDEQSGDVKAGARTLRARKSPLQ